MLPLGYVTHRINSKPFIAFAESHVFVEKALENPLVHAIITKKEFSNNIPS
jgi:hypothetical protein